MMPGTLETQPLIAEDIPKLFPELASNSKALAWVAFNKAAGPAFIGTVDGKPVGFGGLRVVGIAEAWMYASSDLSECRLRDRITFLRGILEHLEALQRQRCIWKIWAEAVKDDSFTSTEQLQREDLLRFVGFKKNDNAFTKVIQEV